MKALAFAYPVALVVALLLWRFVGEGFWLTSTTMYLPRHLLLAPILLLALLIAACRLRTLWWTVPVSLLLVLFPLMGLVLPGRSPTEEGAPRLRVLSFNVNSGSYGVERIVDDILARSPDLVLLQETAHHAERFVDLLKKQYPDVKTSTEFVIASRFPIRETRPPARLSYYAESRSPRFMMYTIETPLGSLAVYNVHPLSARESLQALRGDGLRREISSGRLFTGANGERIQANSGLRRLQVKTIAGLAKRETLPVIIAGDTNLPALSPLLAHLSDFQDGFVEASAGFGYTFPAKYPFLRLDRVFASDALRFTDFSVGCAGASDHLCVVADLQKR